MPALEVSFRSRLVALGASNLTRGLLPLIDAARAQSGGPVEVFAAIGNGRSYGIRSRFLWRELPGIDGCGLWPALAAAAPLPTTAVVMDVGNDVLYGIDVPTILGWVDRALGRLRPLCERLLVVGLPLPAVRRLSAWRFTLVRSVLVPSCHLSLATVLSRSEQLQRGLWDLAERHAARFVEPRDEWYGFDPVHIRRRSWRAAFGGLLGVAAPGAVRGWLRGFLPRARLNLASPALQQVLGVERRHAQPALRLRDGTAVSFW
jgi:hypothetical protein